MQFTLTTGNNFYSIEHAKQLKTLGFTFTKRKNFMFKTGKHVIIELSTIQELVQFLKVWNCVILDNDVIEIYEMYLC